MIVLDTNVISELFRPVPDANVMRWVGALPGDELFTTAITRAELLLGLNGMPDAVARPICRKSSIACSSNRWLVTCSRTMARLPMRMPLL